MTELAYADLLPVGDETPYRLLTTAGARVVDVPGGRRFLHVDPEALPSGSFGPSTAGRMDSSVEQFQAAGGSMVTLAEGNRSQQVTDACRAPGGSSLGSISCPAARQAQDCIRSVEVLEYLELGMEAIWKIEVEDCPAFMVVDDKGEDFFGARTRPLAFTIEKREGLT